MKTILIVMTEVLLLLDISYSQNIIDSNSIVGVWQERTPIVSAAYGNIYLFFKNKTFKYYFNSYYDWNNVKCLMGKYKLEKDTIFFKIEKVLEIVGGTYGRGGEEQSDWVVFQGRQQVRKMYFTKWEKVVISKCEIDFNDTCQDYILSMEALPPCINIHNTNYFQISGNPEAIDNEFR